MLTLSSHRIKASDITDEQFMSHLDPDGGWTNRFDLAERLGYPHKVVLAKARTLILRRQTLHGCECGCRGDFHRADECKGC